MATSTPLMVRLGGRRSISASESMGLPSRSEHAAAVLNDGPQEPVPPFPIRLVSDPALLIRSVVPFGPEVWRAGEYQVEGTSFQAWQDVLGRALDQGGSPRSDQPQTLDHPPEPVDLPP